ncbi:hypothetical protein [Clostridium tetani]|uniref:hypothetical protein n=1 Tax=Clostridium tetani TaxID=1513 RepID=UPI00100B9CA9|nr:hypothetical protein [Clostridium tetani]RXM68344.1 hypothetical protein DP139_12235 [Clostridium tetani]
MKSQNVCIWKIEKKLEEITFLLNEDCSKYVKELKEYNILDSEKKMIYKWTNLNECNNKIKELLIDQKKLRYIKALAEIEYNAIPFGEWIVNDKPLPKELRVNRNNSTVMFVERMGSVYCIVIGGKSLESRIRSRLMHVREKDSSWGEVQINNIREYSFNKNFYYWLLHNKGKTLNIEDKELKLNDVKGFKSDTDRKENSYRGQGSNIDSEIPLKSIVSMDESVVSLYIDILLNGTISYSFFLDYDGRIGVCQSECGEFATQTPQPMSLDKIILDIYFDIIPFLHKKFNEALSNGWEDIEKKFKKRLSIDIIFDLIRQNSIEFSELEEELSRNKTIS